MRVGTDGVLLGAWADVEGAVRILDIGTGCGLIALMVAQRAPEAQVTGIDIDQPSVQQARENIAASPFAKRMEITEADVRGYETAPFDRILCNPPYHNETLLPPDARRAAARHTQSLPLPELIHHAARLLAPGGTLSLIIPTAAQTETSAAATACGLMLTRLTQVHTTATKPPSRILAEWEKPAAGNATHRALRTDTLTLTAPDGKRTPEHEALTSEFYQW